MAFNDVSLKARNIKCFGDVPAGFEVIKPINIAIGRNNCGKSTLLDVAQSVFAPDTIQLRGHKGADPNVIVEWPYPDVLAALLPDQNAHVDINPGQITLNLRKWARNNLQNVKKIVCQLRKGQVIVPVGYDAFTPSSENINETAISDRVLKIFQDKTRIPFGDYKFRRILADRDIRPEPRRDTFDISPNGTGFTDVVKQFLTRDDQDLSLIENTFLDALNDILRPDIEFSKIRVRQRMQSGGQEEWEVHLEEEQKGASIPLSQTGSGVKTVMLVLANTLIMPRIQNAPLHKFVFAFEELENNLHPAAQRRLFQYLRTVAVENQCHFFITTHSNVVIDLFAHDPEAQIVHVTHDRTESKVARYSTTESGWNILDDLDIRASDILQSNAVIWVEGPSDRIYIRRWIQLWSNGEIQEGLHYRCLFFGGDLGAHFSFEEPDEVDDLIAALQINQHAIFITDSDRKKEDEKLKKHAKRLIDQVNVIGGCGFATSGRAIEHYIPPSIWHELSENPGIEELNPYVDAIKYAHTHMATKDTKVKLARKAADKFSRKMLEDDKDLSDQLQKVCVKIRDWNRLPILEAVTEMAAGVVEAEPN
jgi:hypothetical protein